MIQYCYMSYVIYYNQTAKRRSCKGRNRFDSALFVIWYGTKNDRSFSHMSSMNYVAFFYRSYSIACIAWNLCYITSTRSLSTFEWYVESKSRMTGRLLLLWTRDDITTDEIFQFRTAPFLCCTNRQNLLAMAVCSAKRKRTKSDCACLGCSSFPQHFDEPW